MKSPITNILLNGEDITDFISDFEFEDSMEKDNLLTIQVNPTKAIEFLNRSDVVVNTDLKFQFGYIQGDLSSTHLAKISDIDANYSQQGVKVTIKALDAGNYLKKTSSKKVYINKTSSQIAQDIADKNGLEAEIDQTNQVWENMPQANLSDIQFLKNLCEKEDDFVCYIRGKTLTFKSRGLKEESKLTFTYGESNVISFKPKQKMSGSEGTSSRVKITEANPYTGEFDITEQIGSAVEETGILNSNVIEFDAGKNELNEIVSPASERSKEIVTPTQNKKEAQNISKSIQKKERMKGTEADLIIEGNPLLHPKEIITMKGVANRHSGNWQITSIKHKINSSGYTSSLTVQTNGTNDGGKVGTKAPKSKSNQTVGPNKKKNTVKVKKKSTVKKFNSSTNSFE